jgi:hypothetical protein
MSFLFFSALLFFALNASKADVNLCPGGGSGSTLIRQTLNFDDVVDPPSVQLNNPYRWFTFYSTNTAYTNVTVPYVSVLNVNNTLFTVDWQYIYASPPSILAPVCGTTMGFHVYNNSAFGIYTLKMRAVINNTQLQVTASRNGNVKYTQLVTAVVGSWLTLSIQKGNIDLIEFACVNPDPASGTCACVVYDDIDICNIVYVKK